MKKSQNIGTKSAFTPKKKLNLVIEKVRNMVGKLKAVF